MDVVEGAEASTSRVEVAGNLCSGTTIDEGSCVAEGTKSLVSTDVEGDGGPTGDWKPAAGPSSSIDHQ